MVSPYLEQPLRSEAEARAMTTNLAPCPFCGGPPAIEPWHGGSPDKHVVHCQSDTCNVNPMVTGENEQEAVDRWNARPAP